MSVTVIVSWENTQRKTNAEMGEIHHIHVWYDGSTSRVAEDRNTFRRDIWSEHVLTRIMLREEEEEEDCYSSRVHMMA